MTTPNHLRDETSPYLQQHAANPVDWYPWGKEALQRAWHEDKPILLSIGYSACHWCHVMAHESFEDPATAQVMNERFINIKVDREERPDLDRIYQSAHQLLTGRGGGWPLTMFLTPGQVPFFGGTYFPPEPRHGLPAFADLLRRIAAVYHERRDDIDQQNASVLAALAQSVPEGESTGRLDTAPLARAQQELAASYDRRHHGFGNAPKFPHPTALALLLRRAAAGDGEARTMALETLRAMAHGGLQDQLGGGFFRYAVDAQWEIPHFEKMLYDNAQLLALYTDGWRLAGDPYLREVAIATGEWAMNAMQHPEGGYFATLDADSGGGEGRHYLWREGEMEPLLAHDEFQVAALHYGLDQPPNFEGRWHLQVKAPLAGVAATLGIDEAKARALLAAARQRLLAARAQRIAPGRDEKVLTAWNGLMITGMARAGRCLERPDFIASAEHAVDFLRRELFRDGRLLASWKDGSARLPGYLDDYAFLLEGLLELLQARWRDADLTFAAALADALLDHFEDEEHGGFYFTADDHEALIHRPKPLADESLPAGNGVAARALLRYGHLTGDLTCLGAAEAAVRAAWSALNDAPYAHGSLLLALHELLTPPDLVVIRGEAATLPPWLSHLAAGYRPRLLAVAIPNDAPPLPEALAAKTPQSQTVAYLCRDQSCQAPLYTTAALDQALAGVTPAP